MWREGYVPGGTTRFFCRALGHGDDVVLLLHGWPEDGSAWRHVAPRLADSGWRVVAPDLKGFGRSDAPKSGYDPETLGDEISQLIRNLHVRKVVLVGHDWGGAVALATAFRHSGHVRHLVMMSSPYRQIDLKAAWHIPLFNVPVLPEIAFRVAPRQLVTAAVRYAAERDDVFDDETFARYAAAIAAAPKGWLSYYRTMSRQAVTAWAMRRVRKAIPVLDNPGPPNTLRVPATVVWGREDRATPIHLGRRVAYDLKGELVEIPGVGHFPHEEDPDAVAKALLQVTRSVAA